MPLGTDAPAPSRCACRRSDRGLRLTVSDNGAGFDSQGTRTRASLGLASMRERVRLQRGHIDIESTPGRGTTVVGVGARMSEIQ